MMIVTKKRTNKTLTNNIHKNTIGSASHPAALLFPYSLAGGREDRKKPVKYVLFAFYGASLWEVVVVDMLTAKAL